jgi:hypothetical protein
MRIDLAEDNQVAYQVDMDQLEVTLQRQIDRLSDRLDELEVSLQGQINQLLDRLEDLS